MLEVIRELNANTRSFVIPWPCRQRPIAGDSRILFPGRRDEPASKVGSGTDNNQTALRVVFLLLYMYIILANRRRWAGGKQWHIFLPEKR